jgi:hypothetical protein
LLAAIASSVALALTLTLTPTLAYAEAVPREQDISDTVLRLLEEFPGGTQVGPDQISWNDGAVILTLEGAVGKRALNSCASGRYCAWDSTNYTGNQVSFSSCSSTGSTTSVLPLTRVWSIANKRTSGHVVAGSYSLSAGISKPIVSGVTSMTCFTL